VSAYGVRIGLRATEPEGLDRLLERLPHGWKPGRMATVDRLYSLVLGGGRDGAATHMGRYNLLYENGTQLSRALDVEPVLEAFEWFSGLFIAECSPRRIFVHAGVVGWQGRAIILPGRTMSGKTTLTAALVGAGALYLSDEYAVVDGRGRVHPFPKTLSVREDATGSQRERPVGFFGGQQATKPLPAGLVVVSRYEENARFRPRRVSPGRGLLELLANTVPARREPDRALRTLEEVVHRAPVLKGVRGEATEAASALLERAEREFARR
jgi:hypothetical protein